MAPCLGTRHLEHRPQVLLGPPALADQALEALDVRDLERVPPQGRQRLIPYTHRRVLRDHAQQRLARP